MCSIFSRMLRLLHRHELPIDIQNNSNKYYKQMLLNSLRHNADECALPVWVLWNDMHVPTSTTASFASCRILMLIPGSLQSCQPCHVSLPHTQYTCREFSNISNADMDPTFRIHTPRERGPQCINSLCPYASSNLVLYLLSLPPAIH